VLPDTPSVEQLSQIIVQVTVPSFLLGAVAAFVSLLVSRMNRVIDRIQTLNSISDGESGKAGPKKDVALLKRRAGLLNKAILFVGQVRY
jgi:hypothetical protein